MIDRAIKSMRILMATSRFTVLEVFSETSSDENNVQLEGFAKFDIDETAYGFVSNQNGERNGFFSALYR